jgi:GT2 family glycosyltransferase
MAVPVLLLVFNRPDHVLRQIEVLGNMDISCLYVAADGPRPDRQGELERCDEVRELIRNAGLPFPVKTLFQTTNLGCGLGVTTGISWFFQNVDAGVILEDDCIADPSFLPFCEGLLDRYFDDERIMMISGNNFLPHQTSQMDSYSFLRASGIWGWASWSRAWDQFDYGMTEWPQLRRSKWLLDLCHGLKAAELYWRDIFDEVYAGRIDSWAYRWNYSRWRDGGLVISPPLNLVRNIGFDESSTHTDQTPSWYEHVRHGNMQMPLAHPIAVIADPSVEIFHDRYIHDVDLRALPTYRRIVAISLRRVGLLTKLRRFKQMIRRWSGY